MLDLHSCSIDGKLCEPELREWLLSSADISLKRVDGLLELLDDNDVDTVKDLARLATMTCFDTILKPVTASKVREALASREGSTALPVRDLPAERGTRLDEGASPPATPTREPARDDEVTPPTAPLKPAIRRSGSEAEARRRVLFAPPVEAEPPMQAVVSTSCAAVVVQSVYRGQLGRRRADTERDLQHHEQQFMRWQREEWARDEQRWQQAIKVQHAWRLRLWGDVQGPITPPWFWGEGPVLEVLSPEQRFACEESFWFTSDECAALDLHHLPCAAWVAAATTIQHAWWRWLHTGDDKKPQATDVQGATPSARAPAEDQEGTVPAIISSSTSPKRHGCPANGTLDGSNISSCAKDADLDSSLYLLAHLATRPWLPRSGSRQPDAHLPYAYRCPPGAFDAVAWYDAWLRGASLRGQPADSDDSDSADDTYNDFDDPRSRAQLVTRWLHQVLSTDFERMKTALTEVPYSIDDFEIDARLPAAGQLKIFAHYGWLDGPPSPLYVQRRMVQLARERYERALASAKRLHPGKTVTFPMTFAEFEKARSWEAGGGFYFIAPRSGGKGMRQQDDSVRDEDVDETDFLEY